MASTPSSQVSLLIRRLRQDADLTQAQLATLVGTTQSVISRLESDDYEGHSLSMLYRIGAALNRKITVKAVGEDPTALSVHESAPSYGAAPADARADHGASTATHDTLAGDELERFIERLTHRFGEQGVTEADVREAVRWARGFTPGRSVAELRGAIEVGRGSVVDDIRRVRAQRGYERAPRS